MKVAIRMFVAAATAAFASQSLAADVAPNDVKFTDMTVTDSLTGQAGDAEAGAKTFKDRKLGNCLACHANKAMSKELFHGDVGPALDGVAGRYQPAQLRAILVNAKAVFGPDTTMPGFYSLDVGKDIAKDFAGKTILSAQDVENIIAYLTTLKE